MAGPRIDSGCPEGSVQALQRGMTMADKKIAASAGSGDTETRRPWVKPRVLSLLADAAELGGDTSADGDPGFS